METCYKVTRALNDECEGTMRSEGLHWAYRELKEKLKQSDLDRMEIGTVFLVDSEMTVRIDRIIKERLWPSVLMGLRGSAFGIQPPENILNGISTKHTPILARELAFSIMDPKRPAISDPSADVEEESISSDASAAPRTWYVRGLIEARIHEYQLEFEVDLEFPESMDARWVTRFIKNPRLRGGNPRLSVDSSTDEDIYTLTLSRAQRGQYCDPRFEPERIVPNSVRRQLDIIWAADLLADRLWVEPNLFEEMTDRGAALLELLMNKLAAFYGDQDDWTDGSPDPSY
ncbi:MAG: hypothetical protein ACREDR_18315 [Blastocatellia bacterium]